MENVLVCVIAKTRAHDLTFPSFKRHVLDELNGDLALALTIDGKYDYGNPFWQHAKYRWTAPDFNDYGEGFDLAQQWLCQRRNIRAPNWRSLLRLKGIWAGRIQSSVPHPSASAILPFCRWLLLRGLLRDEVLDRYDRFVISRSDFMWLCPHPPLSILDPRYIWVPDGEHWGGLNDRHMVVSRRDLVNSLNGIEDILLYPDQLFEEMKHKAEWNDEQFLAHHFRRKGLLPRTQVFPYVMYTARSVRDESPAWSTGRFDAVAGHFVKYKPEFRAARAFATVIHNRADWERKEWTRLDFRSVVLPPISVTYRFWYFCKHGPCRFWYFCKRVRVEMLRPGRVQRILRFLKMAAARATYQPAGSVTAGSSEDERSRERAM
jgi:hypothetical protein